MGRFWVVLGTLCVAAAPTRGWAAPAQESVEVGTVLVSPRRIPGLFLNASEFPGQATVITAQELKQSGAATVQEAIANSEGISFSDQQGFGLGSDGTLNLRGIVNSARTNVLVLLDGVRQNRITGDEVHWQSIPVDQIERIEIMQGGSGLIYGEGALAGVISIVTKNGGEQPLETEEGVEVGSFGWQNYSAAVRGHAHPLTYGVNYTRRLVDGYRASSWSRNTTVTVHGGLAAASFLSGSVNVMHSDDTTAFPGGLTAAQTQQNRRQPNPFHGFNDNVIDQVSLDLVAGPWEGLTGVLNLFWRRWVQTSEDSINFNSFTVTPSRGLSFRTNYEWIGQRTRNLLVSGMELTRDKATTGDRDAFPGPDSESNRQGYGLYAEDTLTLGDRVSLVGGARLDKFRYEESLAFPSFTGTLRFQGWSPKLAMTYAVVPEALAVFASYARPFKAPNVDDFSARLPSFSSNANLQPQQADTYEVGAKLTRGPLRANATWFYTRLNDEILFNNLVFTNQNFDTRRVGLELAARAQSPHHRLHSYVTYTLVDAQFRKGQFTGNTIPGTPRHTLNAGIGVAPVASLWIDLDWQLVNDFFRINDLTNTLGKADNYGVFNLTLRYELPAHSASRTAPVVKAFLKIENITNEEYVTFQSSNGLNLNGAGEFPMPPTTFTGGVSIQF